MGVPSRGRLGLGVTEVELLRGRQKLVSTFIPDDSQKETAETQPDALPTSGFSLHKIFKGLQILETGVLVLEFVKTILSALVINPWVDSGAPHLHWNY